MTDIDLEAVASERDRIRTAHLRDAGDRPASTARGLHHTALISSDVERTVRFYQDLLGFPLTELIENRDYPGSSHFFFDIGNGNLLAFFDFPGLDVGPYAEVLGGLHHMAISMEPAALAGDRPPLRGRRGRARHPQRGLGLLHRSRRRPDRAHRRPAGRDVRRARAVGSRGSSLRPGTRSRQSAGSDLACPSCRCFLGRAWRPSRSSSSLAPPSSRALPLPSPPNR